jgi:hypothetical protein
MSEDDRVFSDQYAPLQKWWDRLRDVLAAHGAHRTLEALAPGLSYDEAHRTLEENELSASTVRGQVLDLFTCVNGFVEGRWTRLFPDVDLLSLQQMIEVRARMLDVAAARPGYPSYAGFPAYGFVPEFVPFAERDGNLLVTDMRVGSEWAEVVRYDKVDADEDGRKWPYVAHMIDNLISAIADGDEFDGWTVEVVDGELHWGLLA